MPDRGGLQALYRVCDSVSGANWRPTRFEDELTLVPHACCVCHVIPSTTVLLPCSHALCDQCLIGCADQDGGGVCPLDKEPFCDDECQKLKLPDKKKWNLKAHCWNEADGCEFVGSIEQVLLHYDKECAFHALQCPRCERRILRSDIAAHYVAGCSQNASCASGGEPNKQDGSSTSCNASVNVLDKLSTLQRQMNEVSARAQDISSAVSGFENSLQRGIESIQMNIGTMVAKQLNAGLEELRASNPCSDHLSSLQSQMNELVEQSRQRDGFQIQEFARVLRECESELKEHVNNVEANLTSKWSDQQQVSQKGLDSMKRDVLNASTEDLLAAAASGNEGDVPWRTEKRLILRKLEICATESLNTLERLSQHICRKNDVPWVSGIAELVTPPCVTLRSDSKPLSFNVTLGEAEKIFGLQEGVVTFSNQWYYRDIHIKIISWVIRDGPPKFVVCVECINASENSRFPFTKLKVTGQKGSDGGFLPFEISSQGKCKVCSRKKISHFIAYFNVELQRLSEDGIIKEGKLALKFEFQK
ncbi:hypothetical protein MTO96_051553 [Rhipicephalus appendiculatus]